MMYSPRRVELRNVRKLIALSRILLNRVGVTTLILLFGSCTNSSAASIAGSTTIGNFSAIESKTRQCNLNWLFYGIIRESPFTS